MKLVLSIIALIVITQMSYSQTQDGPYKKYYESGALKTEGEFKNEKRVGKWKNYHENGQVSKLYSYEKGKQTKVFVSYYENGTIKYKIQLEDDFYVSRGYFKSGILQFEKLLKDGYYKEFFENSTIKIESNYTNYQLDGIWKQYNSNGQVEWRVFYKNGYRDGVYQNFYENGQLKIEGQHVKNKKDGKEMRYREEGSLEWEGYYRRGSLNKTWIQFDERGEKLRKIKFKEGIAIQTENKMILIPTEVPDGVLEKVPLYPGCEEIVGNTRKKNCMSEKLSQFILEKFNTNVAFHKGLSGKQKIYVIFKIDKTGSVINVKARGPHPVLEEEAIRVIKLLPKLTPGFQRGKAVIVPYSLPIIFELNN